MGTSLTKSRVMRENVAIREKWLKMPQFGWTRGMENMYYAQWCLSVIGVPSSHQLFMIMSLFPRPAFDRPKVIWWKGFGKLRSRVRRMMMTRGLIAVTTCDQERGARDQMMTLSLGPSDGQGEQRRERERSQFGEKSVPEFPGLSRVSPPWAPNLTSTTGSCFRSLVEQLTHGSHQHTVTHLLSALSIRSSIGQNVLYKNTRRMPCKWSRKALKRVRMILPESLQWSQTLFLILTRASCAPSSRHPQSAWLTAQSWPDFFSRLLRRSPHHSRELPEQFERSLKSRSYPLISPAHSSLRPNGRHHETRDCFWKYYDLCLRVSPKLQTDCM